MLQAVALLAALASAEAVGPPSDAEVLRALPKLAPAVPLVFEETRDNVTIVKNRVGAKVGPQRPYPLLGPARLVEAHWECAVYYTGTVQTAFPFPLTVTSKRATVVYIDKAELVK